MVEFSWSKSRDSLFNECKRKYYYNHYGFFGVKEIYILKKLISKEMWIGQVVHDIIKKVLSQLKLGNEISLSYALNLLRKRLDKDYNDSKSGLYREMPKEIVGLFEHEYEVLVSKDEWDDLFKLGEECLINFYNSDTYRKIKDIPRENWILLEDFLEFNFEGTKVYLSIDFAIKEGDKIILYDWKTGRERESDAEIQLACYALFVLNRWDIPPENIVARIYNLRIDKEDEFVINPELIEKIKNYIKNSMNEMKGLLKDKESNIAEKENFPMNKGPLCSWCNFKRRCLTDNLREEYQNEYEFNNSNQ